MESKEITCRLTRSELIAIRDSCGSARALCEAALAADAANSPITRAADAILSTGGLLWVRPCTLQGRLSS